jgi:hypothetical protein
MMDIEAEVALHHAVFYGEGGKPVGVQVTLQPNWFKLRKIKNQKPSVRQVAKFWAELQDPEDSMSMHVQLHMIKRAMLEWPKMGAAIAKLARKKFLQAKKEAKALKRRQLYKYKKMLGAPVPAMLDPDQANRAADRENLNKKNATATWRFGKKVIKK